MQFRKIIKKKSRKRLNRNNGKNFRNHFILRKRKLNEN